MRITITIIGLFVGLVMHDYTVIPMRLSVLIDSGQRPREAVVSVALFLVWMLATALVYAYPVVACCLFALAGGVGLYYGLTYSIEELIMWGSVGIGLAALTSIAGREKRLSDQIAWTREQHDLAMHASLRNLHEAVPELLSRASEADANDPDLSGLVAFRPAPPELSEAARR